MVPRSSVIPSAARDLVRSPLAHFLVLGAALLALGRAGFDVRMLGVGREAIVVSAAQVERVRAEWIAETGQAPDATELEASVRHHADEEILVREALRRGLDRSDPIVRSRLVQNLRFVHGDPQADEAAMFAEALALGMNRSDFVVRRRLVEAMEAQLAAGTRVSAGDARGYVAAHPERYAAQPRISFEQVFIDADRHRTDLDAVATRLGAQLAAGQTVAGEPFLLGSRFVEQSDADLVRGFGASFARAALAADAGAWVGPLRSAYGLHFVRITGRSTAPVDAAAAERAAYYALLEERERQTADAKLAVLRRAYPLSIEWPRLALQERP